VCVCERVCEGASRVIKKDESDNNAKKTVCKCKSKHLDKRKLVLSVFRSYYFSLIFSTNTF